MADISPFGRSFCTPFCWLRSLPTVVGLSFSISLLSKLQAVATRLASWSRGRFTNGHQRISHLQSQQQWIREPDQLKDLAQGFFAQLYTTQGYRNFRPFLAQCPSVVTPDMNASLQCRVTEEEIYLATCQLGASKSPGPDGLPGLFYRHHWAFHLIGVVPRRRCFPGSAVCHVYLQASAVSLQID